jgi:hypothetical protein
MQCGCSAHYFCSRCGQCYVHGHRSFFRGDKWFWECLTDGAVRRAGFDRGEVIRAETVVQRVSLGFKRYLACVKCGCHCLRLDLDGTIRCGECDGTVFDEGN